MYTNYTRLRDERGLTDAEVSKGCGVAQYTLSDWKRGKSVPKVDKLVKIAAFFGVTLDELVNGSGTNEQGR